MKIFINAIIAFIVVIFITIISGLAVGFSNSEIFFEALMYLQLVIISSILACLWNLIIKDKIKFKKYLVIALVLIFICIIGFQIETNINYSPSQLYDKGSNLIEVYYNLKDTRRGMYNPAAIFIATSYLEKSTKLKPDYVEPRIELAKYYLYKREYDKILFQCSFIEPKIKDKNSKILKLEAVAYVFSNNIDLAKNNYTLLKEMKVDCKSIERLISQYDSSNVRRLEVAFFLYDYKYFIEDL